MKDWRSNFVICEHVANHEKVSSYRVGCRASCGPCMEKGFLNKPLMYEQGVSGLVVGRILPKEVA